MSRLSELAIRPNNQVESSRRGSTLPGMLRQEMQLMSGVRKGDNYYIAIHGKSYNDIVKSFKIPVSVLEQFYSQENEDDVNAVIAFALEALVSQMGGM